MHPISSLLIPGVALLALVLLASPSASGQTSISVAGGAVVPFGRTADALRPGYNATAALTAKPPLSAVGIRLEGMFNSFALRENPSGGNQRVIAGTANATLSNAETPLRTFYFIAGVGYYRSELIDGSSNNINNDIGFNVGLGMNLTTAVGAFVEARYHHLPSELGTTRFVPITLGLRF